MKKLIYAVFVCIILILGLSFTSTANDNSITISADPIQCYQGDEIEVCLNLTENSGFNTLLLSVEYDEDIMTLLGADNKATALNFTSGYSFLWDSAEVFTDTGALVVLKFKIAENAPNGIYDVDVKLIESYTDAEFEVAANIIDPKVTVGDCQTQTEDTDMTQNTETETQNTITEIEREEPKHGCRSVLSSGCAIVGITALSTVFVFKKKKY